MRTLTSAAVLWVTLCVAVPTQAQDELSFRQGVEGYEGTRGAFLLSSGWDTTHAINGFRLHLAYVGSHGVLRFDDVAEPVHAALAAGRQLASAHLELHWIGNVGNPVARWSAQAFLLRRPWDTDPQRGPTWNAYVNGLGYWRQAGAGDPEHDRYPDPTEPVELSAENPVARLDLTAFFADPQYGPTLAERLRRFESHGLLLLKADVEGYANWSIFAAGVGHEDVDLRPRLVFTLRPGDPPADLGELPAREAFAEIVAHLEAAGGDGEPPNRMPPDLAERLWRMPEFPDEPPWQRQRREELLNRPNSDVLSRMLRGLSAGTEAGYNAANEAILSLGPEQWRGWATLDVVMAHRRFYPVLVPETQQRLHDYFHFWLSADNPERDNWWRTRSGWIRGHQAEGLWNHPAMGQAVTILGGQALNRPAIVAEGAGDLAVFLNSAAHLGSPSEFACHYYFAMTTAHFAAVAEDADDPYTRLLADLLVERHMLDYVERYHPGSRQVSGPFDRTHLAYLLGGHEGMLYFLHVLAEDGALLPEEDLLPHGHKMDTLGIATPPDRIGLVRGWSTEQSRNLVNHKPVPYQSRSYSRWRLDRNQERWLTSYVAPYFTLGSAHQLSGLHINYDLVGHWQRTPETVDSLTQRCTLWARYVFNDRDPFSERTYYKGGRESTQGPGTVWSDGIFWSVQHGGKVLFVEAPAADEDGHITSAKSALFLSRFGPEIEEIWIGDRRVTELPARASFSDRILIKDGPVYVALLPLPATDLGRRDEVTITEMPPHLVFSAYNFQSDQPTALGSEAYARAWAGWVVEMAGADQFPTFADFRAHLAQAQLLQELRGDVVHFEYRSGEDVLEFGYRPPLEPFNLQADYHLPGLADCIAYQRVNGESPYPPAGIVRESDLLVMGTTGRLEKNGVVLTTDTEPRLQTRVGLVPAQWWLLTEPRSGIIEVVNALELATEMRLEAPDGLVATCASFPAGRLTLDPRRSRVTVETFDAAPVEITGMSVSEVLVNGQPLPAEQLERFTRDGQDWVRLPLPAREPATG